LVTVLLAGCGDKGGGTPSTHSNGTSKAGGASSWLGIPSALKYVTEAIHDTTGWVLNKNHVSIVKVSDVRGEGTSADYAADFKISVTNGTESFETTAKDMPCDKNGIPVEKSVEELREAVE
jgi:hypothetical protein